MSLVIQAQSCNGIDGLYQTLNGGGGAEVYKFNPLTFQYDLIGNLDGADASSSAFNAITGYVYSPDGNSQTVFNVYDPANSFNQIGQITVTGVNSASNFTLFSKDSLLGYINESIIVTFDVTKSDTVAAENKVISGEFSAGADYVFINDFIYGLSRSGSGTTDVDTIINLTKIDFNTGVSTVIRLVIDESDRSSTDTLGVFGAVWQDNSGNLYGYNNDNRLIYRVSDVENSTGETIIKKIFFVDNSSEGGTDGFGCELLESLFDFDFDLDGISNLDDIDDDNDGILDIIEGYGIDPTGDNDNDIIPNYRDDDDPGLGISFIDSNGDGTNDYFDYDLDGLPNSYDLDSDNDGIPDNVEAQSTAGYILPERKFTSNGLDSAYLPSGITPQNTDASFQFSDTQFDFLDADSDNDGLLDTQEAGISLSNSDSDNDGLDDSQDATADVTVSNGNITDPTNYPNSDASGDVDYRDPTDSDNDGVSNSEDLDFDNDGILNSDESIGYDFKGDNDGDGILNYFDVFDNQLSGDGSSSDYTDANSDGLPDVFDIDNDGIVNLLDLDSDNDGIYDAVEAGHEQHTGSGLVSGSFGNDGIPDAVQGVGNEDSESVNYIVVDSDMDVFDFLEQDSDNDGCPDVLEAGFLDQDADNIPGVGTETFDVNGLVNGASYTDPLQTNFGTYDYRDATISSSFCDPLATDDILNVAINVNAFGYILINDDDPQGDPLSISITGSSVGTGDTIELNTGNAVVKVNSLTGYYTYEPVTDFIGKDEFEVIICDDKLFKNCDTSHVYINVIPNADSASNSAPVGVNDAVDTRQDSIVYTNVLANDSDPDRDMISAVTQTNTLTLLSGIVSVTANGDVVYVPPASVIGTDTINYQLYDHRPPSVLVDAKLIIEIRNENIGNTLSTVDDAIVLQQGDPVTDSLLTNDYDLKNNALDSSISLSLSPSNGTVSFTNSGVYTYTPNSLAFIGTDVFSYVVCDTVTDAYQSCDTVAVVITILPKATNRAPVAVNDLASVAFDGQTGGNVIDNDNDPDGDDFTVIFIHDTSSRGEVIVNTDGSFMYSSIEELVNTDTIEYMICDVFGACDTGILYVNVLNAEKRPRVITPNIKDESNDTFIIDGYTDVDVLEGSNLKIYNRWGVLVYEMDNYDNSWAGETSALSNNKQLPTGTYYYVLDLGLGEKPLVDYIYLSR